MHALVVCLINQFFDPTLIVTDVTNCAQMLQEPAHHARHGCDRFKHNSPVPITFGKEPVCEEPHCLDHTKRDPIWETIRNVVDVQRVRLEVVRMFHGFSFSLR